MQIAYFLEKKNMKKYFKMSSTFILTQDAKP